MENKIDKYMSKALTGDARAQYMLGNCYNFGLGADKNHKEAAKWYLKAAEQGYAEAQYSLGSWYANADYAEKNLAEAAKWYRKAAEQGHIEARRELSKKDFIESSKRELRGKI